MKDENKHNEVITIHVDEDIKTLVPIFLKARDREVEALDSALRNRNFEVIHRIGHNLVGTASAYGFTGLSEIGDALCSACKTKDAETISRLTRDFADYLKRVNVVYE